MYAKPWFSTEALPFLMILYSQTLHFGCGSNANEQQQKISYSMQLQLISDQHVVTQPSPYLTMWP